MHFTKVAFSDVQKADIEFSGPLDYYSLPRLHPSRFLDTQDVEKEWAWPIDTLKHRFNQFTEVEGGE
jgi:hypothetical protein